MDVQAILKISGGEASFADIFGGPADLPGITLGVITRLILDMRAAGTQGDRELPSIPIEDLAGCDSYYIAIDNDWSQGTAPKMTRTSGISVVEENGLTLFKAELPNTAAIPGLAAAIEAAATKSITLHAEIGGTKAGIGDVFAYSFSLVVRNRIWLPDGSPEDIPSDPDYLNTVQVTALINAAVAEALEDIVGEAGPPPTITIGTVTSGATASATLTLGAEPGAYALDLVLPVGPKGNMPTLAVGTVEEGEASAEIVTAEGGFVLNLTVPRGLSGAGVTPRGIWAGGTTYAINDAVRHGGAWWRSLQAGNIAHTPPAGAEADAWWETIVKDGSNGIDAEPFLRVYNDTDDVGDPGWHDEYQPGDIYFRDSIDGGATWTVPIQITAAPQVILLFNPDATTDWTPLTPGATYSTGTGKFMRARQAGGVWGVAWSIHDLDSQALRVQFSAGGGSPTWHATLQPGDRLVRFYNVLATIDKTITISDGTFDVAEIQLCSISDPWHAAYRAGDQYRKISVDSGATYGLPIPLFGKSAYQTWLDLGNHGSEQDFLDSLVASGGGGITDAPSDGKIYGRRNAAWVEIPAEPGGGEPEPAETMYYGYIPYEVAGSITAVTQITLAMLSAPGSTVQSGPASILGKTAVGSPPAGSWLVVFVPAAAGLSAQKFDGLSGPVDFAADNGAPGTGANGSNVSLDGDDYLVYGEFRLAASDAHIYVNEVQS